MKDCQIPLRSGSPLSVCCGVYGGNDAAGGVCAAEENGAAAPVARALDAFHDAASRADEQGYFEWFAPEGVFIGTAPGERWTVAAFREFVHPYFSKGNGWTYVPREGGRRIGVSADGRFAWFDEVLDNEKYGECRGTGALRKIDGHWRILQYSLVIPIPNEIAGEVVEMIAGRPHSDD